MELVEVLEQFEQILLPFSETIEQGARRWDGKAWSEARESQIGDPYAAAWAATFRTAAQLFRLQQRATDLQLAWLKKTVFGGMGSFSDYQLSSTRWGSAAQAANAHIERLRTELWSSVSSNGA